MNSGRRSATISMVSLIVVILAFLFGIKPILAQLHKANLDLAVVKKECSQKEEKLRTLQRVSAQIENLKTELNVITTALPKGPDIPNLLVSLESLIGSSGLSLASITPPSGKESSGNSGSQSASVTTENIPSTAISSVSYNLSLKGDYPSFLHFLANVENNVRPTSISTINIAGGGGGKQMSYSVSMVSYYQQ